MPNSSRYTGIYSCAMLEHLVFTMKNIRVGIIDSGINQCVINASVQQKLFCEKNNDEHSEIDINGHGTMCAGTIERMAVPNLEFVSAKIFHRELKATERQIADALTYMMNMQVDIINMSLSVSLLDSPLLYEICNELHKKGITLISSSSNSGRKTLFESYNNVITVTGSSFFDGKAYWYQGNRAVCDIEPILMPWYEEEYDFFGGNSKATALFTAIVINTWSEETKKFDFKSIRGNALRNTWKSSDICRESMNLPCSANKTMHNTRLTDRLEHIRHVELVTGISMEVLTQEKDWYAHKVMLSANKVNAILDKLGKKSILNLTADAEIYMEYFRNQECFLKFLG